jgi:hypothetical protein
MSDPPFFSLNLFQYADDIALAHQARKFEECEIHLEEGLETLRNSGVYVQIHEKLKFVWEHIKPTGSFHANSIRP